MKHACPLARESVAPARLDRYLTRQLRKMPGFETVDKMTEPQIVARVRAHFRVAAPRGR